MPQETNGQSVPSLEVDLNRISEIAAELDRDAANEASDMRTRKRKRVKQRPVAGAGKESIATATTEDGKVIEVDIIPDPQFEAMIMHGSDKGMDYLKDKLSLMEPGDTTRENVAKCLARLLMRLKPVEAGPLSDAVQLAGYLGVWILFSNKWGENEKPSEIPKS